MKVLTLGSFDLFHAGHVNFLRQCKDIAGPAGWVSVALNTDEFIESYKGRPPVVSFDDRRVVLEACRYVDRVTNNTQTVAGSSAYGNFVTIRPEAVVVGSDWEDRDYLGQIGIEQGLLDQLHARVIFVPYGPGSGSTGIKARVLELAG